MIQTLIIILMKLDTKLYIIHQRSNRWMAEKLGQTHRATTSPTEMWYNEERYHSVRCTSLQPHSPTYDVDVLKYDKVVFFGDTIFSQERVVKEYQY